MGIELVILTVIAGLIFDYTNGFHDAANVVATPIATRALKPMAAIIMASICNFLGATQISGVAQTIATGLVEYQYVSQLMVLAAVMGAILWNFFTWYFGLPSSSSYALIGGILGATLLGGGSHLILWGAFLSKVIIPMCLAPFFGFTASFFLMLFLLKFEQKDYKLFRHLQIFSAAIVALSHGLNDAQKSMGIITLALFAAQVIVSPEIPLWVIGACALMMALGTGFGGFRIIHTLAFKITPLKPAQGFAAELSASCIILIASYLAMPLSSTHIIVSSITGVGVAKSHKAVAWATIYKMVSAWVLTLPGAALFSGIFFKMLSFFFRFN